MDPSTTYILAWLTDIGETGWEPVMPSERGVIRLRKGDKYIEYGYKFNSGNPAWFCNEAPNRLRGLVPPPFRKPEK